MIKKVFGHVGLPLPENYADKLKQLQKQTAIAGVKRAASNKSFFSMVSKTNLSSKKSFFTEDNQSEAGITDTDYDAMTELMEAEGRAANTRKKANPLIDGLRDVF
mmetsp:Transcript_12324/g.19116  ORF Transcript_12324/g.19116 Transcript_12324/m.19116 type:complete len:105 (+) Transcript_12324:1227-1541(+)